ASKKVQYSHPAAKGFVLYGSTNTGSRGFIKITANGNAISAGQNVTDPAGTGNAWDYYHSPLSGTAQAYTVVLEDVNGIVVDNGILWIV
nr:hypothetical protein [Tanacetum cinerariifolium]